MHYIFKSLTVNRIIKCFRNNFIFCLILFKSIAFNYF